MSSQVAFTTLFNPSNPPQCSKPECSMTSFAQIGGLNACGSHTNWAIIRQIKLGSAQVLLIGRYARPSDR